jgi:protein-S-isoprenylcysteine O-methyltransferase Ste14
MRIHRWTPPLPLALALLPAMWLISRTWPVPGFDFGARSVLAVTLGSAGLGLCGAAVASFRRAKTTVDPTRPERASSLVDGGVFAYSRNPMYVGFALVLLGWALWLGSAVALAVPPAFVAYLDRVQVPQEERALAAAFGEAYADYRRRVRRWI